MNKLHMLCDPGHFLALGGGSGLMPKGPGTAGTVVGFLFYWPLAGLDTVSYLLVVAGLFACGIPLCQRTARAFATHDHPAIVWDEIVGILLTMTFVSPSLVNCLAAFLLFRIFDIYKPWPIGLLDRRVKGGLGIMLDDAVAAVFAAISLVFIEYLSYIYH